MFNKVLITGGLGLIGSHLSEIILDSCQELIIIDNVSTGKIENLAAIESQKIRFIEGSVLNDALLSENMKNVDFCFHLAASLGVKKILDFPIESLNTNLRGSENVLLHASRVNTPVFLASTSEIYGKNPKQPLREDSDRVLGSPLNVRWSYSEAKALDESMAQMYADRFGLKFVIGRFFNTVGPRQIGEYGMVLPRFVSAAILDQDLEVYGDGSQTRVFCHARDAVSAIMKLVQDESLYGQIFNIGGEQEISIKDLAEMVIRVTDSKSKIKFIPYEKAYSNGFEETFRRVPDTTKLRAATDWKIEWSLEEIILDVARSLKFKK